VNKQKNNNEENDLIIERRKKLAVIREKGSAYPNDFRRNCLAEELHLNYDQHDTETLKKENIKVSVAGRMMVKRVMGKASFIKLQDRSAQIQIRLESNLLVDGLYQNFKKWDVGDIVGATGSLFRTKTGELTIMAVDLKLLTKSLRPLPEKFHGLTDQEIRYRQRYVDLIMNQKSRDVFKQRTQIITYIRSFLDSQDFMEVETPMMQPMPGGAIARPFETHHNALDMKLYLRIAPELFLKRLTVGGIEKVYEINRNFRNEGVSTQHNPEFTMLELYWAYADYKDLMSMIEVLVRGLSERICNSKVITYQDSKIDFSKAFTSMTMEEVIIKYNPNIDKNNIREREFLANFAKKINIEILDTYDSGKIQIEIFDKTCESKLLEPTFIYSYPIEVSPLSRRNDNDPFVADRFEFFVAGKELANGFSELNDPEDQEERFRQQASKRQAGDHEAMPYDYDYIRALEYGLPPTAGLGVGIDRLVMLLTDAPSIRDVLLFPHMRLEVF
jgi:lysyl-tRNA synthetase class 2